jgi:hypothetical protein
MADGGIPTGYVVAAIGATIGIVLAATGKTNMVRKGAEVGGGALAGLGVGTILEGNAQNIFWGTVCLIVGGGAMIWGDTPGRTAKRAYLGNPRRRYRRLKR